jgi:hypothetical protein
MALDTLEAIANGSQVFGLVAQQDAGTMNDYVETAQDVENRYGIVVEATRFFGRRNDQWCPGGGGNGDY